MSDTSVKQITLENLLTNEVHELRAPTIIGRHEDCDLVLAGERGASRKHARVTIEDGLVVLMDLGSLNGTIVNGHEINRPVQLADGDVVLFDQQEYRFAISSTTEDISQNVTVIANKAEVANPENIKPAIQILDEHNSTNSFDGSTQHESVNDEFDLDGFEPIHDEPIHDEPSHDEPFNDEPIAATSRPGGHTPSTPVQQQDMQSTNRSSVMQRFFVLLVFVILIGFIAFLNDFQFPKFQ